MLKTTAEILIQFIAVSGEHGRNDESGFPLGGLMARSKTVSLRASL